MTAVRDELIEELLKMHMPLVRIGKMINRKFQSVDKDMLAPSQMVAMAMLQNQPPLNMTQLSELLCVPRQQLTKIMDALVGKGLVERYTHPNNRRVVMVEISRKGQAFLHNYFFNKRNVFTKFIDSLNEKQINDFLEAIRTIKRILSEVESELH